jgi:glycerol-3-phosphate dehydrogenase subunit C
MSNTTDEARVQSINSPCYQANNISANNFEGCIKCTICTVYCPVAPINSNFPGPKQAGPDGERYRLKKPSFFDESLKYCLNCKRCEVACPSNVRIGDIIQSARMNYSKKQPSLRDAMLASTDFMGTMATPFAPIVNGVLKLKPTKIVLDKVLGIDMHRQFPAYTGKKFVSWFKSVAAEQKNYPHQVSYFHGCYVNYNFPQLGKDFVTIMNSLGYGINLLEKEKCCGVAKIANQLIESVKHDATINLASIRKSVKEGMDVLTTSSTCTLTIRDEYHHILGFDTSDVREHLQLATRFIYRLIDSGKVKVAFRKDFRPRRVAYHTPCHMQKLGWGIYSTSLLSMIPGLELVPLEPNCCGISGTYGFKKENYKYSQQIGSVLFDQIKNANVESVATDCETCKWQIEMSTGVHVDNPISLFAEALDVEETRRLNGIK